MWGNVDLYELKARHVQAQKLKQPADEDRIMSIFYRLPVSVGIARTSLDAQYGHYLSITHPDPTQFMYIDRPMGFFNSFPSRFSEDEPLLLRTINQRFNSHFNRSTLNLSQFPTQIYHQREVGFLDLLSPTDYVEAFEAGAWQINASGNQVIIILIPSIRVDDRNRLHSETGPALKMLNLNEYNWHGTIVPEHVITRPGSITLHEIMNESNITLRRIKLERFGEGRFVQEAGVVMIDRETFNGREYFLYRHITIDDEPLLMLKVTNATPEPDGTFCDYWLRVPPTTRFALEGVAWTFNLREPDYRDLHFES